MYEPLLSLHRIDFSLTMIESPSASLFPSHMNHKPISMVYHLCQFIKTKQKWKPINTNLFYPLVSKTQSKCHSVLNPPPPPPPPPPTPAFVVQLHILNV